MADGEFKIAEAFVEVNLRNHLREEADRAIAELKAKGPVDFETALKDPNNIAAVKRAIESGKAAKLPTEADNPIDDAWRAKVNASLKATAKQALQIPITPESEEFRRNLAEVLKEVQAGLHAKIPADVDQAAKFRREVETLAEVASQETKVRIPVEVDTASADRARQRIGLLYTALSVGLPAAAAVGAAGTGLALASVPILFGALAAAALKSNDQVAKSWSKLGQDLKAEGQSTATLMSGTLVDSANTLGTTAQRLRPLLIQAFSAAKPEVEELTDGVSGFAYEAMPGFVTAIRSSDGPMRGLSSLLKSTGAGVTDLFTNLSRGSDGARQGLTVFGHVVQDLEGFLGSLLANLASGSAGPLTQFQGALRQGEQALLNLTQAGGPAIGFLSGFTGATSGMLGVLNGVTSILGVLPTEVTQLGGQFTATALIAQRFGLDIGAGFEGLGKRVKAAGNDLTGAAKAGTKVGTALGGLVQGALSPATLAVGALSIGLGILGQKHQEAAANADLQRSREQSLAEALRNSGGAIDANVRSSAAASLQDFELADGKRNLLSDTRRLLGPDAIPGLTDAYLGNKEAGTQLVAQLRAVQQQHTQLVASGKSTVEVEDEQGKAAHQLADIIESQGGTFQNAVQKNRDLATATSGTSGQMDRAAAAAEKQKQAIFDLTQTLLGASDKNLAYRQAQTSLAAAHDQVAEAAKKNKAGSVELTQAQQSEEQAMLSLIRAAGENAAASYKDSTAKTAEQNATEKSRQTMSASAVEALNLAAKYGNNLPASIRQYISSMSDAQLGAAGVTRSVDNMGRAVYSLPGGKTITFQSNADDQTNKVQNLQRTIDLLHGKTVTVVTSFVDVTSPTTLTGRRQAFAQGGIAYNDAGRVLTPMAPVATVVPPNTWRVVGDNVRVPEAYIPIDPTSARSQRILDETNARMGRTPAMAGGGGVVNNITVHTAPMEPSAVAAAVSSEIGWHMRGV